MRSFKVTFDVSSEEKIFKGILSLRQMAYMSLNVLCVGLLFIPVPIIIRILLFLPPITVFSLFAFLKLDGIYFDKYMSYYMRFIKKDKLYIYKK